MHNPGAAVQPKRISQYRKSRADIHMHLLTLKHSGVQHSIPTVPTVIVSEPATKTNANATLYIPKHHT